MCAHVLPVCMYVDHTHAGVHGGQSRALDALELELQMFVYHEGAGTQTMVLCEHSECSKSLSRLSSRTNLFPTKEHTNTWLRSGWCGVGCLCDSFLPE